MKKIVQTAITYYNFKKYEATLSSLCTEHSMPLELIKRLIQEESSFNPRAIGKAHEKGLMQIMENTFLGVAASHKKPWVIKDMFNPTINMEAGILYLKEMLERFGKRVEYKFAFHYALASYNAGPTYVEKALKNIEKENTPKNWESLKKFIPHSTVYYVNAITSSKKVQLEKILVHYGKLKSQFVPFDSLPKHLWSSVLCIEDRRFYYHFGVDLIGIIRALITNLLNGEATEGASTITQQLVRLTALSYEKTYKRKIREALLAIRLEKKLTKNQILEFYLNTCYLCRSNRDIFGIAEASAAIFRKNFDDLSLAEAAFLAALIQRPISPGLRCTRTLWRQELVLKYLLKAGKIEQEEFSAAIAENIPIFDRRKFEIYTL